MLTTVVVEDSWKTRVATLPALRATETATCLALAVCVASGEYAAGAPYRALQGKSCRGAGRWRVFARLCMSAMKNIDP
jgi:hypothetical protein